MRILLLIALVSAVYPGLAQETTNSFDSARKLIAQQRYETVLEHFNARREGLLSPEMLNLVGYCYSKLGRYKKAITSYENALQLDSNNHITLSSLADLYKEGKSFLKPFISTTN